MQIATRLVHSVTGQVYVLYPQPSPFFSLSFAVCYVDGVDDQGHVITVTHSLVPNSVTLAPGYDTMREDPDIYKTMDFCGYVAARQFPDMALPMSPAQQQSQQQPPSDSIPVPASRPTVPDQLIEVMQNMHDEQVRFLQPLGRNPCDHFRERNDERILNNLVPDVIVCPFCSRKCRNNQKLKSHCRRHHCKSVALKCKSCGKSFGEAYALKVYMRLHSATARVYKCYVCV